MRPTKSSFDVLPSFTRDGLPVETDPLKGGLIDFESQDAFEE